MKLFELTPAKPEGENTRFGTIFVVVFLVLILASSPLKAQEEGSQGALTTRVTVNVVEWTPVVTEFGILTEDNLFESRLKTSGWRRKLGTRLPFTPIEDEYGSIPTAWKELKKMVEYNAQLRWPSWYPVISEWGTWSKEGPPMQWGLEVIRHDKAPEGALADIVFVADSNLSRPYRVWFHFQIWGQYRFEDDPSTPEDESMLSPVDERYQEMIKKKIEVRDFTLKIHRLENPKDTRSKALLDEKNTSDLNPEIPAYRASLWDIEPKPRSLRYKVKDAGFQAGRGRVQICEIRLQTRLTFPEVYENAPNEVEEKVEVRIRYGLCGGKEYPMRLHWETEKAR